MGIRTACVALWLVGATVAQAQQMALLGINSGNEAPGVAAAVSSLSGGAAGGPGSGAAVPVMPPPTPGSRWSRVPEPMRGEIFRILRAMLEHPCRKEEGSTIVADSNDSAKAYQEWKKTGQPKDTWPEFYFEHGMSSQGRRIFLATTTLMIAEGVLPLIETIDHFWETSPWPGYCVMPKDPVNFPKQLAGLGFGGWFRASSNGSPWGLRSPTNGCGLHFKGLKAHEDSRFVYSHVDINNPGKTFQGDLDVVTSYAVRGGIHCLTDLRGNEIEGLSSKLRDAMREEGHSVPDVDESTIEGLRFATFLKWKTSEPNWYGHIWLAPEANQAGWWTQKYGAMSFRKVLQVPARKPGQPVRWLLRSHEGFVTIDIHPGGRMDATLLNADGERTFTGELVEGHVH